MAALQLLLEAHARGMTHQTYRDQGDGEIGQPRPQQGKTGAQDRNAGCGKQLCRLQSAFVIAI
jgi:hypothetical protein